MLWHPKTLQNLAMYNVFFIFGRFSIAGKLPKWPKIPFQYPLALRHPKILEKCRKHHRILVSVRNRFWGLVSVRNRFLGPPPAKADIATAILTNVIEHLVLLLPPNKHDLHRQSGVGGFLRGPQRNPYCDVLRIPTFKKIAIYGGLLLCQMQTTDPPQCQCTETFRNDLS